MGINYTELREILERKANKAINHLDELKCFVPEFKTVLDSVLYISETLKDLMFLDTECPDCKKGDDEEVKSEAGPMALMDTKYNDGNLVSDKIVMFYSENCGPCRALKPVVEKFADDTNILLELNNIDTSDGQRLALKYNVKGWPFVFRVVKGTIIGIKFGADPELPFEKHYQDLINDLGFELLEETEDEDRE